MSVAGVPSPFVNRASAVANRVHKAGATLKLFRQQTWKQVSQHKATYCIGFCANCLVVLIVLLLSSAIVQFPVIYLKVAELKAGEVDLVRPSAIFSLCRARARALSLSLFLSSHTFACCSCRRFCRRASTPCRRSTTRSLPRGSIQPTTRAIRTMRRVVRSMPMSQTRRFANGASKHFDFFRVFLTNARVRRQPRARSV